MHTHAQAHTSPAAHLLWCTLLLAGACACASSTNNPDAAGDSATRATSQAASTALPSSGSTIHPLGAVTPTPGSLQTPPTPATLPCQHGSVTLTMRADGTDPHELCVQLGTRLTMHLPQLASGPWLPAELTGDRIGTLSTTRDVSGTVLNLTITATGTAHISTQTNPGAAAGAPTRTWQLTIITTH